MAGDKVRVFSGARIIDGTGSNGVLTRGALVIEGARIAWVGPQDSLPEKYAALAAEDLDGKTLLPGFIDVHVHLTMDASTGDPIGNAESQPDSVTSLLTAANALRALEAGFTTVRDVGGKNHIEFGIRDAITAGQLVGPDILASGRFLTISEGRPNAPSYSSICDSPDAARRATRQELSAGADVIKIMATGNVTSPGVTPGAQQFTEEEMRAAIEAAHWVGKKTSAHAQGTSGIIAAVRAGIDSIDHGCLLNDEAIDLMLANGTFLVPTFAAVVNIIEHCEDAGIPTYAVEKARELMDSHLDSFSRALKAGVRIALGTDAGCPFDYHGRNAQEFVHLTTYGMTPQQAIVAGTAAAAECCGLDDRGSLEIGKRADIVVVDGDPLEDISVLQSKPVAVIKAGQEVDFEAAKLSAFAA